MKRTIRSLAALTACAILLLAAFGCGGQNPTQPSSSAPAAEQESIRVTFINEVQTADVWILPQTAENLKSTLWGTASSEKLEAGGQCEVRVEKAQDGSMYLLRIIDDEHAYYAANDLHLEDGYSVCFRTEDTKYDALIEIADAAGSVRSTLYVFEGALGAQ